MGGDSDQCCMDLCVVHQVSALFFTNHLGLSSSYSEHNFAVSSGRVVEPFPEPDETIILPVNNAITNAFQEARSSIDTLFRDTEPTLITDIKPPYQMIIPTTFWAVHTQSDSTAHQRSYAALVSIAASKKLTRLNLLFCLD
uniref:Uncharacterized protein n=1 Tax=Ascaris lumbricoides TaxID=6252 RepID=A0A0M3ITP4_ASCLU